jgi:tetratricopeptide (TPR) repeat protein
VIGPAVGHVTTLKRLLGYSVGEARGRRLRIVTADAMMLVSRLWHLMGHYTEAWDYVDAARDLAVEANDAMSQARVLGLKSLLSSTIPNGGRRGSTKAARELAQQAAIVGRHAPAADCAWFSARAGFEHAKASEAVECWRTMEAGAVLLTDRVTQEPADGFWATLMALEDATRFEGGKGLCHKLLGQPDQAEAALLHALREIDLNQVEYIAVLLADLAATYADLDEPEPATASLLQAAGLAAHADLALNIDRARAVRDDFPTEWIPLACMRELDEQLHELGYAVRSS